MIDAEALLKDLRALVRILERDISDEIAARPETEEGLRTEHSDARAKGRTASAFEPWRDERVTQASVAWIVSCTFVRFVEDNGLVDNDRIRLASRDDGLRRVRDAQTAYFQRLPHDTDRDYVVDAFRNIAALPGMADLFDERHNAAFELPVSPDGASTIIGFWRRQHDGSGELVHDFHDDAWDTRFLGDLYQDLSDDIRKRYALLQTPEFVEEFILDKTLIPAIDTFGLADTHLIDPTCGSGHFLLGTFQLLLRRWHEAEPGTDVVVLAQRALDQVAGVDLNPYAVAIARFRLLIAALKASEATDLRDAPAFQIHLAVGDSLLTNSEQSFTGMGTNTLGAHAYHTEDPEARDRILGRTYEAVVGNPPYITVKDKALNQGYRSRYPDACHRQFALTAPFLVRFFRLARPANRGGPAGFVGMITANSFMKREFGKKLVEKVLPKLDLTAVVDTSGAYIPGHGTPTVLLFGRNRWPNEPTVRMVLGIRGEPSKPDDPAKGVVWQAIVAQFDRPGSESPFIGVNDTPRPQLAKHPWSIGGGGAAELASAIDRQRARTLKPAIADIGRTTHTGADPAFFLPTWTVRTRHFDDEVVPLVTGEAVRDYGILSETVALFPYDGDSGAPREQTKPEVVRHYWTLRTLLRTRLDFGETPEQRGLPWWAHSMFFAKRYRAPLSITFAFVATHNHFVLDRGGKVFKQSAPVIKLPEGASEDDHLRLLGLLNSSLACFWMQQVFHNKGGPGGANSKDEKWHDFYEFDSTKLQQFPVVKPDPRVVELARGLDQLADEGAVQAPAAMAERDTAPTRPALDQAQAAWNDIRAQQVTLQEELDWRCLHLYGVTEEDLSLAEGEEPPPLALGERAFEIVLARRTASGDETTVWFIRHRSTPILHPPEHWSDSYRDLVERRIDAITNQRDVGLVERPENKRRWATDAWEKQERAALESWLLDRLEDRDLWYEGDNARFQSVNRLTDRLRRHREFLDVLALYAGSHADPAKEIEKLVLSDAVPAVAAARYKPSGMVKRKVWEDTWRLQRREDAGEAVDDIPVPPKYTSADFRSTVFWQARGKLDVPKERFILLPDAERDVDQSPVVGWAGWDQLEQVHAVAAYAIERQNADAWDAVRLKPLLAAWDELLPWVKQWHNDPDPRTGRRLGDFYAEHLDVVCQEVGLTGEDLRAWEPQVKRRGRTPRSST